MLPQLNKSIYRRLVCLLSGTGVLLFISPVIYAHDGTISPDPTKAGAPIFFYEAVMLSIGGAYGIYLLVRSRRKKNNNRETN